MENPNRGNRRRVHALDIPGTDFSFCRRLLVGAALALVVVVPTSSAFAQSDTDTMQLANALGSVLAAEEPCSMAYDQDAIAAFVDERVPSSDMTFPSTLAMMTAGSKEILKDMNESQKTAHCTQMRRVAKSYGFTE